jgi:hypothetical protein
MGNSNEQPRRGGKRPGAGRKPASTPPLRKLSIYISEDLYQRLGGSSTKAREILEANV